jgi:parallel beta-helix repeat protein
MNTKCNISIGIVCLLVLGGLVGVLNFTGDNVSGTDVSGVVYDGAGGPFTAASSPYIVLGDLTIPAGETLTIEPDVEVRFNGFYGLYVEGTLLAQGTNTNLIYITSNMGSPGPGDWSKISVTSTGHAEIEFCKINYGTVGIYLDSSSNNNIANNKIWLNKDCGIYLSNSDMNTISQNDVSDNFQSIYLLSSHQNTINHNIVSNNGLSYNTPNGTISGKDTNNWGIYLSSSDNNDILANEASKNSKYGFGLQGSANNALHDNIADKNRDGGIYLGQSPHNSIMRNTISEGIYGIRLASSTQNTLSANVMTKTGIAIGGDLLNHWNTHHIDPLNTVNGKSVFYIKNQIGGLVPSNAGEVILANSRNIRIMNQDISESTIGILMGFSSGNHIQNNIISYNNLQGIHMFKCNDNDIGGNTVTYNYDGIYLNYCRSNYIVENEASWNIKKGIFLHNSNGNYIIKNTASYNVVDTNTGYGIFIYNSNRNHIAQNDIFHNGYGIGVKYSMNTMVVNNWISTDRDREHQWGGGVHLFQCTGTTVYSNHITKSGEGVFIQNSLNTWVSENNISINKGEGIRHWVSDGVIITYNDLWDNGIGIRMFEFSRNVLVHHNNIIGNQIQALDYYSNSWDDGYPSGGNYWSDYFGMDIHSGPGQNMPGSDGIGDTPYVIDGDSQDNYPLMARVQPIEHNMVLGKGWNLISIPYIQSNNDLEDVLSSIRGAYDSVQWYKSGDVSDHWKHHHSDKPMDLNDLGSLDHTMGIWIRITEPEGIIFDYSGVIPTENQEIILQPGWNMVGYPSQNSYERDIALNNLEFGSQQVDIVWTFDSATQTWNEVGSSDCFEPGRGYWIHSNAGGTWEVPL